MLRKANNRSRSVSPASSMDASQFKKRNLISNYNNKISKKTITKLKEDVQVFTSLPPKVEGEIKCCLKMQISKINIIVSSAQNSSENKVYKFKQNKENLVSKNLGNYVIRCVWWGEENKNGALFRPKILNNNQHQHTQLETSKFQTVARYMIRCGPKQFNSYLNGKKNSIFRIYSF
jgi:hypothetical protein